jgi:hypothetical protein
VSDNDFDLSRFKSRKQDRRSVEEILATTDTPRPPKKERKPFKSEFIRVPSFWRTALRGAPGATYELALAVLDEKHTRDHKGGDIVLSAEVTGMNAPTRRRATLDVVRRGLIGVDQVGRGHAAPRVFSVSTSSG